MPPIRFYGQFADEDDDDEREFQRPSDRAAEDVERNLSQQQSEPQVEEEPDGIKFYGQFADTQQDVETRKRRQETTRREEEQREPRQVQEEPEESTSPFGFLKGIGENFVEGSKAIGRFFLPESLEEKFNLTADDRKEQELRKNILPGTDLQIRNENANPSDMVLASEEALTEIENKLELAEKKLANKSTGEKVFDIAKSQLSVAGFKLPNETVKLQEEIRNLRIAADVHREITNRKPSDIGFWKGLLTGTEDPESMIPFQRNISSLEDYFEILSARKKQKAGQELTSYEESVLERFKSEDVDRMLDRGTGYAVGSMLTQMPAYAIEFWLTSGAFKLASPLVQKGLTKVVLPSIAKRFSGALVGTAAQTAVNVPMVGDSTAQFLLPRTELVTDENGQKVYEMLDSEKGFEEALARGFGNAYVEILSERAGILLEKPMGILARATLGRFIDLRGITSFKELQDVAEKIKWNGIIAEVFEEELANLGQSPIEERPITLPDPTVLVTGEGEGVFQKKLPHIFTAEANERLLVETLGIAVFGGLAEVTDLQMARIKKRREEEGAEVIEIDEEQLKEEVEVPEVEFKTIETISEPIELYRGTSEIGEQVDTSQPNGITGGVSMSTSREVAERFAEQKGGETQAFRLKPEARVVDHSEIEEAVKGIPFVKRGAIAQQLIRDNNIDAIRFDVPDGAEGEQEIRILNPRAIDVLEAGGEKVNPTVRPKERPTSDKRYNFQLSGNRRVNVDYIKSVDGESVMHEYRFSGAIDETRRVFGELENSELQTAQDLIEEITGELPEVNLERAEEDRGEPIPEEADVLSSVREHIDNVMQTMEDQIEVLDARIIGSVSRGEQRPDSDIDVLVQYEGEPSAQDLKDMFSTSMNVLEIGDREVDITFTKDSIEEWLAESEEARGVVTKEGFGEATGFSGERLESAWSDFQGFSEKYLRENEVADQSEAFEAWMRQSDLISESERERIEAEEQFRKDEELAEETQREAEEEGAEAEEGEEAPEEEGEIRRVRRTRSEATGSRTPQLKTMYNLVKGNDVPVAGNIEVKGDDLYLRDTGSFEIVLKGQGSEQGDGFYRVVGNELISQEVPDETAELAESIRAEEFDDTVARALGNKLGELIEDASRSVSSDETRPVLTGLRFNLTGNVGEIVSTDGFRMFRESFGMQREQDAQFTIPELPLRRASGYFGGDPVAIKKGKLGDNDAVQFEDENVRVTVAELVGNYPKFENIYPNFKRQVLVSKSDLKDAVNEIAPFAKEVNNIVNLSVTDEGLNLITEVEGTRKEVSVDVQETRDIDVPSSVQPDGVLIMPVTSIGEGEEGVDTRLNYKFLKDALLSTPGENISVNLADQDNKPVLVTDLDLQETQEGEGGTAPTGGAAASIGEFADIDNVTERRDAINIVEMPELVQIAKELTGEVPKIKMPRFRKKFGGHPLGLFSPVGNGEIQLNPEVFKDPKQAAKTLAHELGHLHDYLPQKTMSRNTLANRIASANGKVADLVGSLADVDTRTKIKDELWELSKFWKPLGENPSEDFVAYRKSAKELYADAISVLYNDPDLLRDKAPTFYNSLFEYMDENPDVANIFYEIQDLISMGKSHVNTKRRRQIREAFDKAEDIWRMKRAENKHMSKDVWFRLKQELMDVNQAMIDRINEAKARGEVINDDNNPEFLLNAYNYVGGTMKHWVETNINPIMKDLEANGLTWNDLGEFLLLERIMGERGGVENPIAHLRENLDEERFDQMANTIVDEAQRQMPDSFGDADKESILQALEGMSATKQFDVLRATLSKFTDSKGNTMYDRIVQELPKGIANPFGLDVETAGDVLNQFKEDLGAEEFQVLKSNVEKFRDATAQITKLAYEEGDLYTPELYEQLQDNSFYATFQVIDYLENYVPSTIYKQVGTLKEVANPATSTVMKMLSTIRASERNKVRKAGIDFIKEMFPNEIEEAETRFVERGKVKFREPIPPKDADKALVTVIEGGKRKGYYVDPFIASSYVNQSTQTMGATIGLFRFFNKGLFRPLFITFNLGFQSYNLMRDFLRTYKNTPGLSLLGTVKQYTKAVKPSISRAFSEEPDEVIQEMEKSKILGVTYNDLIRGQVDEEDQMRAILRRYDVLKDAAPTDADKKAINKLLTPGRKILDFIEKTGNTIETMPKVVGFRELRDKMPANEMADFVRTSIGSPDFLRKGEAYRYYNEIFLFSNAIKEGIRADMHVAFKNPRTRSGFWFKTAMTTFLPKMIMFAALHGALGDKLREMFENISEYDMTNYIDIPLGFENGKTIYFRMPQDETGRLMGGIFWKVLNMQSNRKSIVSDIGDIASYTGGQLPSLSPIVGAVIGTAQFLAGKNPYDFFRGRTVIDQDAFEADDHRKWKQFILWQLGNLGLGTFMRVNYYQSTPSEKGKVEKIMNAPILSNIIGRWIKVSDYGQKEKNREILEDIGKEEARERLDIRENVTEYIKRYQTEGGNRRALERELVTEVLGHYPPRNSEEKRRATNTVKKFRTGLIYGKSNPNLESLIEADTNDQKAELLFEIKNRVNEAEYKKILDTARKNKIISGDVLKRLRQIENKKSLNLDLETKMLSDMFLKANDLLAGEAQAAGLEDIEDELPLKPLGEDPITNKTIVDVFKKGLRQFFDIFTPDVQLQDQQPDFMREDGDMLPYILDDPGDGTARLYYPTGGYSDIKQEDVPKYLAAWQGVYKEATGNDYPDYAPDWVAIQEQEGQKEAFKEAKATPTPYNETIKNTFESDAWVDATRVLRWADETGILRGENVGLKHNNMDVPNRINPETGKWDNDAPIKQIKNPFTGEMEDSIDRGLFRINNATFYDYKRRMPKTLEKYGITEWDDMNDLEKNVRMAWIIYKNQGWGAWFAAPPDLTK